MFPDGVYLNHHFYRSNYLAEKAPALETLYLRCAESQRECHLFQISSPEEKHLRIGTLYKQALDSGARHFFIYCNSLSSTVDFPQLSSDFGVHTVTPMTAYEKLARRYNVLGVLAANNQCTKGIEDHFTAVNPNGTIIGVGNLRLTEAVEAGLSPQRIASEFGLSFICDYFRVNGCQAIVLGCTHFPYFMDEITSLTDMPVLDPADIMLDELLSACH